MNPSKKPHVNTDTANKKRLTLYVIIAFCLVVFVAVNVMIIFYLSEENKEASGNRSNDFTMMIVNILCPNYDRLDGQEQWIFLGFMRTVVRKVAHFLEFALLGFLSGWLMLHLRRRRVCIKLWMTWAFPAAFCLLNAAFDEIHQIFSERGPSVWDVCIDFTGALFGLCLIQLICWIGRCIRRTRHRRRVQKVAARAASEDTAFLASSELGVDVSSRKESP